MKRTQFNSKSGKVYDLALDITKVKAVQKHCGVNLNELATAAPVLGSDVVKLVDTLWLICRAQAEALEVDDETFGRDFDGDSIEAASTALMYAMAEWTSSDRREQAVAFVDKMVGHQKALAKAATEALESGSVDAALDAQLQAFTGTFSKLRAATAPVASKLIN